MFISSLVVFILRLLWIAEEVHDELHLSGGEILGGLAIAQFLQSLHQLWYSLHPRHQVVDCRVTAVGSGKVEQGKFRLAACSDFDVFCHIN